LLRAANYLLSRRRVLYWWRDRHLDLSIRPAGVPGGIDPDRLRMRGGHLLSYGRNGRELLRRDIHELRRGRCLRPGRRRRQRIVRVHRTHLRQSVYDRCRLRSRPGLRHRAWLLPGRDLLRLPMRNRGERARQLRSLGQVTLTATLAAVLWDRLTESQPGISQTAPSCAFREYSGGCIRRGDIRVVAKEVRRIVPGLDLGQATAKPPVIGRAVSACPSNMPHGKHGQPGLHPVALAPDVKTVSPERSDKAGSRSDQRSAPPRSMPPASSAGGWRACPSTCPGGWRARAVSARPVSRRTAPPG